MVLKWSDIVRMDGSIPSQPSGFTSDSSSDDQKDNKFLSPISAYTDWWLRTQVTPPEINGIIDTRQDFSLLSFGPDENTANIGVISGPRPGPRQRFYSAHPFEYSPVLGKTRPRAIDNVERSQASLDKEAVIMGIIDDGLALANARFLKMNGDKYMSRAEFFWNQDAELSENIVVGYQVPFGRDWDQTELDGVFDLGRGDQKFPNEEAVYRELQMDKILSTSAQHGTHVMDLATGYDSCDTSANALGEIPSDLSNKRPIIAVQLARIATRESSGAFMSTYVTEALDYILLRAQQLQPETGKKIPLIINFSYGIYSGTLSGNHHMEEWIDIAVKEISKAHDFPIFVTLPAGNSHLGQCFGERQVRRSTSIRLPDAPDFTLRTQPDNKAPTVVEFFWPETEENEPQTLGIDPDLVRGKHEQLTLSQRKSILEAQSEVSSDLGLFLWAPGADKPIVSEITASPNFFHGVELRDTSDRLVGMLYHERLIGLTEMRKTGNDLDDDDDDDDDVEDEYGKGISVPKTAGTSKDNDGNNTPTLLNEVRKLTLVLAPTLFEQSLFSKEVYPCRDLRKFFQKEAAIPAGEWGVSLFRKGNRKEEDTVVVRCQRGDTPFGFRPFGRQSRLIDQHYQPFTPDGRLAENDISDQWVYRHGTMNAIATGRRPIRVGSYRRSNLDRREVPTNNVQSGASIFSSSGFGDEQTDGWPKWRPRKYVDLAAATEINHALPGVQASGMYSGSKFRFSGTSSAAPQIARWLALSISDVLKEGRGRKAVKAQAQSDIGPDKNFANTSSEKRSGVALFKGLVR
ncbi:hypothetical protein [Labrenzia sp. PHM005]|uniref:hypothetical protein n=1 Tax=Labrenzia sp. PHM005 TaxID=2590016 RepID=UPI00113FCAB9|nr:hypothetical protein [Labrenzia sp. PHM005]QDG76408.1 hypothetical protein FJ695_11285 [Labrenzia sp. PHM005]